MPKLALNKSSLNRERKRLRTYARFLPSLELKQKQLSELRRRAAVEATRARAAYAERRAALGERIPMLASPQFDLSGRVVVESVELERQNAVGVELPVLSRVDCRVRPYSLLAEPHWVDVALSAIREVLRLGIEAQVAERRLALLEVAVRKITQRVNLFDEVLIPKTTANIRRIGVFLGDAERAAVIRGKISKRKREARP